MSDGYHEVQFACAVEENSDGGYDIVLRIIGIPTENEVNRFGNWLHDTIMKHLGEMGSFEPGGMTKQ